MRPSLPLSGVRIVDITNVVMGPLATHVLADLGGDVIKIEAPEGDILRQYRPARNEGMAGIFLHLNRNKRSVVLDLKSPDGRAALDQIITSADVFVHALRPQAIRKLGYDYEHVRSLKPDIIYCGAYGFGVGGRYAEKAAYDDLIQAVSGLAALQADGQPRYLPTVICDKTAGQAIATAVLAALLHRERGGGGQAVEVPMFETMVEFNLIEHFCGAAFDPPMGGTGFPRVLSPHRKPYRTRDGYACILPYTDRNWRDFLRFIERDDLLADPRVASLGQRSAVIDMLYEVVANAAPRHSTAEWIDFCDSVSIPCMPLQSLDEVLDDGHLCDVGFFETIEHPTEGPYRSMRVAARFSGADVRLRRFAPQLGQHTREVLEEIGAAPALIDAVAE